MNSNRGTARGGKPRGSSRGTFTTKQVRFTSIPPTAINKDNSSKSPSPGPSNPFAPTTSPFGATPTTSSPFAATTNGSVNPFATNKNETSKNPFNAPTPAFNPFGAPSQPSQIATTTSVFGGPSGLLPGTSQPPTFTSFGKPSEIPAATSNPPSAVATFGRPSELPTTGLGPSNTTNPYPFGAISQVGDAARASPKPPLQTTKPTTSSTKPPKNGFGSQFTPAANFKNVRPNSPPATSNALANTMDQLLRTQNILPPSWPTSVPGDPSQKAAIHAFWQTYKTYRGKVRAALIRAGLLDDPDKPKKLSEAIDFKGICEDMCPEFERITRIVERDVQSPEKELISGAEPWPAPEKMVKALARSAAGQDAPLPMDVRSPAALRRTFDYLLHTVLGEDGDLPAVHGFLWDRTRAIRRDFVFQSSMSQAELSDQIYCLERITRFHVVALHQMSHNAVVADDKFSEQQEIEQLGKALLSLIHAYEDCQAQGINCENEAEFRAYYVLFNSHNSGILETVQDWGWKFWSGSDQIKIAVSLVEALQNIWDTRGPLKPYAATDIAQNGFSRFFSIVGDKKVSYTMACFAEIHFNGVRKSALKTILAACRKQRDKTKDWTLTKLNRYLRFDEEEDVIEFGEAYGLQFQDNDGETYLSFESDEPSDPFPPLKQPHSYSLVERKRGNRSLPIVIDSTVYDDGETISSEVSDEESLFVRDKGAKEMVKSTPIGTVQEDFDDNATEDVVSAPPTSKPQVPASIFNQPMGGQAPLGSNFFASKSPNALSATQSPTSQDLFSRISTTGAGAAPSILAPIQQPQTVPSPHFSFLNQPVTQPAAGTIQPILSIFSSTQQPQSVPTSPFSFINPSVASTSVDVGSLSVQNESGAGKSAESPKTLFQPAAGAAANTLTSSIPAQQSTISGLLTQELDPQPSRGLCSVKPPKPTVEYEPASIANPIQQLPLPQSQSNLATGLIFNTAPQPTLSSALTSQSQPRPTSLFPGASDGGSSSITAAKSLAAERRRSQFDNLANWVFVGDGGILDQFIEHFVGNILFNTFSLHQKEEAQRIAKEEADRNRDIADDFRYRSLAVRYGRKWRVAAHRMWMKKKGREARKARQQMAESLRASKAFQSANIVEEFRASKNNRRRGSLESLLDATGVLDGVHNPSNEVRAIVRREEEPKPGTKQQESSRPTNIITSSINGHKRGKSDGPLRRSLLSDPTFLHGGSRIHLMPRYDAKDETRRQVSGVQTDYFRLKARGISTLSNGTPLASSAAKDVLHQKRSFDGITKPETPQKTVMPPPAVRSVPAKSIKNDVVWNADDSSEVIQAMKARAKALMDEEPRYKKRSFDDDEELFARAKRVREQMEDGLEWYSKQIEQGTASRSVS